jgi:hypothetical protein
VQEFKEKMARGSAMKPHAKLMSFFSQVDRQSTENCTDAWDLGYVAGDPEAQMRQYRPWGPGEVPA